MDIQLEISRLKKELDQIDDIDLINAIKNMLAFARKQEKVIGYSLTGEALTQNKLVDKVMAASKRVKSGQYIDHDDLENEVKDW